MATEITSRDVVIKGAPIKRRTQRRTWKAEQITCPVCLALAGERCRSPFAPHPVRDYPHNARAVKSDKKGI